MQADSVANSRALSVEEANVNKPSEVSAMFDSISYGKVSLKFINNFKI